MQAIHSKFLDIEDVKSVIRHPDVNVRAIAAQKVCRDIRAKTLSDEERKFAHELLRHMAEDSAEIVRRALAVTLKNSPKLPHDIALKLAEDIDNIAVPVLTHSPVFTDQDLITVLKSKAAAKAIAVAKRTNVSDHVVRAIIRFGDSHAVAEVAANDGALISEEAASEMLAIFKNNDLIAEAMISRRDLPVEIMERLITMGGENAAIRMAQRHDISVDTAIDIADRTRERAIIDFVNDTWSAKDVRILAKTLFEEGRLTQSLLIRAMCSGQMRFAEQGLACLAGVSVQKAALMIHDGGPFGLKSLCDRAQISGNIFKILQAACKIYRDFEVNGVIYQADQFRERMIQRVLTLPYDLPDAEQYWFLEKLDGFSEI